MTTNKEVFKVTIIAKIASVNLDNVTVSLNSVTMTNEDGDEYVFQGRQWDYSKERCSDGIKIFLYIVNDGTRLEDRMDWLIDEEFSITKVDAEVKTISTNQVLEFDIESPYGEQTKREMKLQVSESLEASTNYLVDRLTEGNQSLKDLIFNTLEADEGLQKIIKQISESKEKFRIS